MRFYRDWYRPDLMAVIVVGDVDRDAVVDDDQGALLVADVARRPSDRGRPSTCRIIPARATPSSPTRKRPRPRSQIQRPSAGAQPGIGRRLSRAHARPVVRRHARRRLDELSQRANPPFLRAAADRALFPTPRTRDEAMLQALVVERRRGARSRRARHRAPARRAVRLHRDRARAREAGDDGRLRARRDRKPGPRVRRAAPTSTRGISSRAKRCRRSGRSSRSIGASSPASRWPRSTRSPRTGFPIATGSSSCPRRKRPASSCPIRRSSRPS